MQTLAIVLVVAGVLILAMSGLLGQIIGKAIDPMVGLQSWVSTRVKDKFISFLLIVEERWHSKLTQPTR